MAALQQPLATGAATAELVRPAAAVTIDPACGMSFGAWKAPRFANCAPRSARASSTPSAGAGLPAAGRGKSPRMVMTRLKRWSAAIAEQGVPVVAVSHKAAIRALLALATGWDMTGRSPHKLDWRAVHFFVAERDGALSSIASPCAVRPRAMTARVFFCVQHLLGIGHLCRAATLARALASADFDVLLVSGSAARGPDAGWCPLPPTASLRAVANERLKELARLDGAPVDLAFQEKRANQLVDLLRREAPDVLITEQFPFGRTQLRFELVPLLAAAKALRPRPLIVSSLRDVVRRSASPQRVAESIETFTDFDALLIHADPALVRLEELSRLGGYAARATYTGYVMGGTQRRSARGRLAWARSWSRPAAAPLAAPY